MVNEFQWGRTGAAFGAVHHNEVGRDAGVHHGFGNGKPLPGVTNTELEAGGLSAGEFAQTDDELQEFNRRIERTVGSGRDAIHPHRNPPCMGDFSCHFGAGQNTAVAGLGALAEFDLDHFDLRMAGVGAEFFCVKRAVVIAATKVPRSHFPNQITPMFAVVH